MEQEMTDKHVGLIWRLYQDNALATLLIRKLVRDRINLTGDRAIALKQFGIDPESFQ